MAEISKKRVAVFGSTGSVGVKALQVIDEFRNLFEVEILTGHNDSNLLIKQALKFKPNAVVVANDSKYTEVKDALAETDIKVFAGDDALQQVAAFDNYDIMFMGIVGFAGLKPILKAIESGKVIALANKEAIVVAGDIMMQLALEKRVPIIPVSSAHSSIFQSLIGEQKNKIEKVVFAASGGPFIGRKPNFLVNVKKEHTLTDPLWKMGHKITVDSATLMNKGLDMLEAKWLFNLHPDQMEVVLHPQGIVHSMVQFEDGSIKAQLSRPDIKIPIQYALNFPVRRSGTGDRLDYKRLGNWEFDEPDIRTFRNLALAKTALKKGGNMPAILNAANEIAVWAFLNNRIGFLDMTAIVEKAMEKIDFIEKPNLTDYFESDAEARNFAASLAQL